MRQLLKDSYDVIHEPSSHHPLCRLDGPSINVYKLISGDDTDVNCAACLSWARDKEDTRGRIDSVALQEAERRMRAVLSACGMMPEQIDKLAPGMTIVVISAYVDETREHQS